MGSKRIGARWLGSLIVAAAVMTACSDSTSTSPAIASKLSSQPSMALNDLTNNTAVAGTLKICKLGNATGTFAVSGVANTGGTGTVQNPTTVSIADVCRIAALGTSASGTGFDVTVTENAAANTVQTLTSCLGIGQIVISCVGPYFINAIHGVVLTYTNTFTPPTGTLSVCKVAGTGVTVGTNFSFTAAGTGFQVAAGAGPTGTCSNRGSFNVGTAVTVQETVPAGGSVSIVGGTPNNAAGNTVITIAAGTNTVTFTNTLPVPVCDFITFGRLVTTIGGEKVVVSGNAGGNQPGGGILAEFHIEVNGVDNHVADVAFYGPIASNPLASATNTNSRRTGGIAKNGNTVELRLWDGGEPGKDTDKIWFSINGTTYGPATIDQGNMQYHANCRGPGE